MMLQILETFAISVFFIGMKKYVITVTINYICLIFPILKFFSFHLKLYAKVLRATLF